VERIAKFPEHSLYIEKYRQFMNWEPEIKSGELPVCSFESLAIKSAGFEYTPCMPEKEGGKEKKPVRALTDVSLEIRRGEKIALVGYNGAGKTTLIKLLLRLYDVTEGEILYNGINIKNYNTEQYRSHIGVVFQDYKLFAATIAENVLGGDYTDTEEQRETVLSALRASSFEDKLAQLPDGINTPLTREFDEKGVNLSGGESQKVAIARVFAKPYELIIMDEPSSALDPISEYKLNHSILEGAKDRTVIFISHRLSTTRMADRIYMFENGSIIESGSHEELMALDGKYSEMFRVQAEKYQTA